MSIFKIHTKITWRVDLAKDWEDLFYPSLVKKINKSNDFFNQNFYVVMHDVDEKLFTGLFFPLYEKEIAERSDYHLDKEEVKKHILKNIREKKVYKLFSLYTKKDERFVGGTLFHIGPDRVSIALRVIERAVNQEYKKRTTVDFWFESQFVSHVTEYNNPFLYHGMDSYPRRDHEIGLALFKLQVGAYPIISSHETKTETYTSDQLIQQKPIIFFDNPDTEGFFKSVHLWYKLDQLPEEVVKSFKAVFSWAGIRFVVNG